jgi:membrane protein DedA with SNARE-associated domain
VLGSLVFTGLGYLLSGSATALVGHVKRVELWLLGAVIVGVVIVFLVDKTAKHELHLDERQKEE